jgi:hypothetical protein
VIEVLHRCSVEEGMTSFVPSHQKGFPKGLTSGAGAAKGQGRAEQRPAALTRELAESSLLSAACSRAVHDPLLPFTERLPNGVT